MFKRILFLITLALCFSHTYAGQKIYVANPEKAHQVNAKIISKNGQIENTTWFRLHQSEGNYLDVSSVHGDNMGVFFYDTDVKNRHDINCWGIEYHLFFRCDRCGMLQDCIPPPCLNRNCPSYNQ